MQINSVGNAFWEVTNEGMGVKLGGVKATRGVHNSFQYTL